MNKHCLLSLAAVGCAAGVAEPAHASFFDLMQIEQVIGGVAGDTAAQAIQLRMRADFQCFVSEAKLMAHDAAGENPVLLIDFQSDLPGCNPGDRVLIVSENFCLFLDDHYDLADFTLTNLIPQSYLAAGSITFEDDAGTIVFWRLSWGGKNYTGPTDGSNINDADGEFGPPWPGPLPSDGLQALQFQGPPDAQSTNNQDDYALGTSTWRNNAGAGDGLVSCPANLEAPGGCGKDVGILDLLTLLANWGPTPPGEGLPADLDCDGNVGILDLLRLLAAWGPCPCP
ncbi:MAG: hypothetical protein IH983_09650 [Planctomycetes bacterium]|nr:hypothetical protein [Planctomycetota bacterium]